MNSTDTPETGTPAGSREPSLKITTLTKSIGESVILRDVNLCLEPGDFVGLIGPNGAGKTTLIKCITGQLVIPPDCVYVNGLDVALPGQKAKENLGYAIEPNLLPEQLTGKQFLELVSSAKNVVPTSEEIRSLGRIMQLTAELHDEIGTYSAGMRQKLSIIASLLGKPKVIILDESLNSLDPVSAYNVKRHLQSITCANMTSVLLASHHIGTIEKYCTHVAILFDGEVRHIYTHEEIESQKSETGMDLEELFISLAEGGSHIDPHGT